MEERIGMKTTHQQVSTWAEQEATLEIMAQMDRHPGHRPETVNITSDIFDQDNGDTKSTRTQYCQMSPCPEAIPQLLPNAWLKCFGKRCPNAF